MARIFDFIEKHDGVDIRFIPLDKVSQIRLSDFGFTVDEEPYRFYHFSNILECAIKNSSKDYIPNQVGKFAKIPKEKFPFVARKWREKSFIPKSCKILSKIFKKKWEELLVLADQNVVRLDKAVTRASGFKRTYKKCESFYKKMLHCADKYAYEDCCNYRAATQYFLNVKRIQDGRPKPFGYDVDSWADIDDVKHYSCLDKDWKDFYSPDNITYTALNKTLMAMNYPVAFHSLQGLQKIKLERPILSKVQLSSLLSADESLHNIIYKTDPKDIIKAVHYFNKLNEDDKDCRKVSDISSFWYNIRDFVQIVPNCNSNLKGLVKRSHEWHERRDREHEQRRRIEQAQWEKERAEELKKLNVKPPFDLEKLNKGIRFLETVKDLHDESGKMHHCVSGYSKYTTKGDSFIFHIDYEGDMATLELSKSLQINQCQGVRNKKNKATEWATKYFNKFINNFRKEKEKKNVELCTSGG